MKIKKNIAVSESGFVFDPSTGESFSLNKVGLELVELLKQGEDFDIIKKEILEKYDVDEISFEKYYYDFINSLNQNQLLED
ncbi:MAG: PqqD family protein [Bacteroidota bacterium]|nr:PqqD family protein [Bacteroidota bacterium]